MRGPRSGGGQAASQSLGQFGVCRGCLACIDLASAVYPRDGRVGDDGIDERDDGSAVAAEDVGHARGVESLDEELSAGEGSRVMGDNIIAIHVFYLGHVFLERLYCRKRDTIQGYAVCNTERSLRQEFVLYWQSQRLSEVVQYCTIWQNIMA